MAEMIAMDLLYAYTEISGCVSERRVEHFQFEINIVI